MSREGGVLPQYQAAQVQRQRRGHGMEKAGGRRGFGWDRAPVVPSCPVHVPPDQGAAPGQKATKKKGKRGFKWRLQTPAVRRRSEICVRECVWACLATAHNVIHSHPLFSHTGTAGPDVPLASDIFICSEHSLLREGDSRDAPEQILTSSIRSFWCAEARSRGRHNSAGSAQNASAAESVEEWEDMEEQTGQTDSRAWSFATHSGVGKSAFTLWGLFI